MVDINPSPVDGKWYDFAGAQKRQGELISTMPTGTNWWWRNAEGNEVVFSSRANTKPKSKLAQTGELSESEQK